MLMKRVVKNSIFMQCPNDRAIKTPFLMQSLDEVEILVLR